MPDRKASKFGSFLDILSGVSIFPGTSLASIIANISYDVFLGAFKEFRVTEEEQDDIYARGKAASSHLTEASEILAELQIEMKQRNEDLENLLSDIDGKRVEADRLGRIADMKQEEIEAITTEIENRIGEQLRQALEKNKTRRRILSCVVWVITLFAGGTVGFLIQKWLGNN